MGAPLLSCHATLRWLCTPHNDNPDSVLSWLTVGHGACPASACVPKGLRPTPSSQDSCLLQGWNLTGSHNRNFLSVPRMQLLAPYYKYIQPHTYISGKIPPLHSPGPQGGLEDVGVNSTAVE